MEQHIAGTICLSTIAFTLRLSSYVRTMTILMMCLSFLGVKFACSIHSSCYHMIVLFFDDFIMFQSDVLAKKKKKRKIFGSGLVIPSMDPALGAQAFLFSKTSTTPL